MTVVGIQEKSGEYNGTKYHNYLIHCLKDDDSALGQISEVLKVKVPKVKEIFGKSMDYDDLNDLIGEEIRCYYDKFGSPSEIRVVEKSEGVLFWMKRLRLILIPFM